MANRATAGVKDEAVLTLTFYSQILGFKVDTYPDLLKQTGSLLELIASYVCRLEYNVRTAYLFVTRARMAGDELHDLSKLFETAADDWEDFLTFFNAIGLLERYATPPAMLARY
jgi:hypothetical protein